MDDLIRKSLNTAKLLFCYSLDNCALSKRQQIKGNDGQLETNCVCCCPNTPQPIASILLLTTRQIRDFHAPLPPPVKVCQLLGAEEESDSSCYGRYSPLAGHRVQPRRSVWRRSLQLCARHNLKKMTKSPRPYTCVLNAWCTSAAKILHSCL